jgi:UDP-N-acetylglucosamine 2-epimerase (non-hydrolysing)
MGKLSGRLRVLAVAGARPNFMKIAALLRELEARESFDVFLTHTGQHYDAAMSTQFFTELGIREPDVNLEVGSGTHAAMTAQVLQRIEPVILEQRPDVLLVVGDVNSTIAAALAAVKLGVPVAHVEAGLRSFDRTMPEEINRILTDSISEWLFVTERSGVENLAREGVDPRRVHLVGNVMIDTLLAHVAKARERRVPETLGLTAGKFAVLTLHRPSNVDDPEQLAKLFDRRLRLLVSEPLGYLDFLGLMADARVVMTDSGGIQEETTVLGVPCLTLRQNTERPATVDEGTNRLVGSDPDAIRAGVEDVLANDAPVRRVPALWDGRAAARIAEVLERAR